MKHFGQLPPGVLEWLLGEETGKALEAVLQSHIVPGAAVLTEDLLDREVELETLGGTRLGVDGTAGIILVVPLEGTITEVKGGAGPKSETIPASAIVVEAPQDALSGVLGIHRHFGESQQHLTRGTVVDYDDVSAVEAHYFRVPESSGGYLAAFWRGWSWMAS